MAGERKVNEGISSDVSTSPDTKLPPPPEILAIEPVYEALGHSRRRYLCYTLLENTEWSMTDLATKITAWEWGIPEHEVTADQREKVYVSLYHAHVPKLVDVGVITFDETTETISTAEHAEQVLTVLEGIGASKDANQEVHARSEMDE
ncbi:hypothetical protein ACFQJC_03205 [Haloferax namakaokahaiae]|uniref:DUF7344 domain-containing protein n=1 Tax=Haloferax namakaokahaiae TaxID=1748331 RepID=A0ABD5ZB70_9EURY